MGLKTRNLSAVNAGKKYCTYRHLFQTIWPLRMQIIARNTVIIIILYYAIKQHMTNHTEIPVQWKQDERNVTV